MKREKTSIIWKIKLDVIQNIFDTSESYKEILRRLGINEFGGGNMRTLHQRIKRDNIDLTRLNGNRSSLYNKCQQRMMENIKIPMKDILVKNSTYRNSSNLKKRLLEEKLLKEKCYECGQLASHNGKPLTLQLDHINGDNADNRIKNLRLLCPNCHTQTETYCRKNGKIKRKFYVCSDCGNTISKNTKHGLCQKCFNTELNRTRIYKYKSKRPDKNTIINEIINFPILQIGNKYGVSDNAVRKWLKYYDLPFKRKDIKELISSL